MPMVVAGQKHTVGSHEPTTRPRLVRAAVPLFSPLLLLPHPLTPYNGLSNRPAVVPGHSHKDGVKKMCVVSAREEIKMSLHAPDALSCARDISYQRHPSPYCIRAGPKSEKKKGEGEGGKGIITPGSCCPRAAPAPSTPSPPSWRPSSIPSTSSIACCP